MANSTREEERVLSLLTVSSHFNITSLNQGDHCTIAVCNDDQGNEIDSSQNQPKCACDKLIFNTFGESPLQKEILRELINGWFMSKILPNQEQR